MITTSSEDGGKCKLCGGTGWEPVRMPDEYVHGIYGPGELPECYFWAVKRCSACGEQARVERAMASSSPSLDVRLIDFDWTLYEGVDIRVKRECVLTFVRMFPKLESAGLGGLYLSSKTFGTGKTFLARCICGELIQQYACGGVFVTAGDLLEASRIKTEDGSDPLARYIGARMLILDDLGQKSTAKDWMSDVLFRVIDRRYKARRGIIVTSNLSLNELTAKIDGRITDRLYDMTRQIALPEIPVRRILSDRRKDEVLTNLGMEA